MSKVSEQWLPLCQSSTCCRSPLEEIKTEIKAIEQDILKLLAEVGR